MNQIFSIWIIAVFLASVVTHQTYGGRRPPACRHSCCANSDCGSGSICLNPSTQNASCMPTSGQNTVDVKSRIPLSEEDWYWRYLYNPNSCKNGQCSKLVLFFSGGEMGCDDGYDDPNSAYSTVLSGYANDGYLAVCIGLFLNKEPAGVLPFNKEASRVDLAIKSVRDSSVVKKLWDGSNLLIAGVSHGATAPVVAMGQTKLDDQPHWKGSKNTAACFHDGIYDAAAQDQFLQIEPNKCNWLRNRTICGRYSDSDNCKSVSLSMPEVKLDSVSKISSTNFSITRWKLIECGSQLPACALHGDWVPASPIQQMCNSLNRNGRTCQSDSQPKESHLSCMSSPTGIAKCRDWFDGLIRR